jgi:hypothetical protein
MKFILFTVGFEQPTPEIMAEWNTWFNSFKEKIVEQVGLMNGSKVTKDTVEEIPFDKDALTGYLIIEVENKDQAMEIAKKCPMITSTLVYEIRQN